MGGRFAAVIRGQSGLVTRTQALEAGLTDHTISWRLASGRWVTVHPGVYLTEPGRGDWEMQAVAALLHLGPGAALHRRSAAFAWGLVRSPGPSIQAIVPATRRGGTRAGVVVTRSRHTSERTDPTAWPHRIRLEHTIFDLASDSTPERAVALMASACQKGLTNEQRLRETLTCRPRQPHGALLREPLEIVGDGAESVAEVRYVRDVERAHGLPPGHRQAPMPGHGRRDNDYPQLTTVVEVDGRIGHEGWVGRSRDGRRDRAAAVEGKLTVRAFWVDVALAPCELAADLGTIFVQRGWEGVATSCRRRDCRVGSAQAA